MMGCVQPVVATKNQLARRATFDLSCSADALKYSDIDWRTVGVAGCGKRAVYLESCDGPRENAGTSCTWVINGAIVAWRPGTSAGQGFRAVAKSTRFFAGRVDPSTARSSPS